MEKFNFFNGKNIYFIGIGGISMSALARFCLGFGACVFGSDVKLNQETKVLSGLGATIFKGHSASNISKHFDLVVFSGAIKQDNVELKKSREMGLRCMERSEFLGKVMEMYGISVVITGTHGKTTTTALVGEMLINDFRNPSIHLGGETNDFSNAKVGNKDYFVTEGCEYRNSIGQLKPTVGVITNIELDHTDFYASFDDVENAFLHFAENVKEKVIIFENNEFAKKIKSKVHVITAGFGTGYDVTGENLAILKDGTAMFDVFYEGYVGRFKTNLIGDFNAKNCLCAIATGLVLGINYSALYSTVASFDGVKRRMELVGTRAGVPVICDYAHHPTEIKNSIKNMLRIYKNILVVFQPHTFSRTIGLKEEFLKCFDGAKKLVIFKTYPAREKYMVGGSAKELFNELKHKNKVYCDTITVLDVELNNCKKYDAILVLGAGDIYDKVKKILKRESI